VDVTVREGFAAATTLAATKLAVGSGFAADAGAAADLISDSCPAQWLNLQRGRWSDAKKYFQYWERGEGDLDEDA